MKNGYVKLSISEYDALMIANHTKSRQLEKQEEKIAELMAELKEKDKVEKEMREYIKSLKEAQK